MICCVLITLLLVCVRTRCEMRDARCERASRKGKDKEKIKNYI